MRASRERSSGPSRSPGFEQWTNDSGNEGDDLAPDQGTGFDVMAAMVVAEIPPSTAAWKGAMDIAATPNSFCYLRPPLPASHQGASEFLKIKRNKITRNVTTFRFNHGLLSVILYNLTSYVERDEKSPL